MFSEFYRLPDWSGGFNYKSVAVAAIIVLVCTGAAYLPPLSRSCSCEPCSNIFPPSSTMMSSSPMTDCSLWAMTSTVLFFTSSSMARCISTSFSGSRLAVASSRKTMGASESIARAMEIRCFSPPERV